VEGDEVEGEGGDRGKKRGKENERVNPIAKSCVGCW